MILSNSKSLVIFGIFIGRWPLVNRRWLDRMYKEIGTVYIGDKVFIRFLIGPMEFSNFWVNVVRDIQHDTSPIYPNHRREKNWARKNKPSEISTFFRELYKLNGESNDITINFYVSRFLSLSLSCRVEFIQLPKYCSHKHWNGRSTSLLNFIHYIAFYSI